MNPIMFTAEWISSINCPSIFSLGFTFPFVNNDKDLKKHVLHVVHVHLVVVFLFIFKKLHFELLHLCRIILS